MKKEELRKVEYRYKIHSFGVADKNEFKEGIGSFHLWHKSVLENGTEEVYGLVELEDGKMSNLEPTQLKFIS